MQQRSTPPSSIQIDPKVFIQYSIRYWYLIVAGLLLAFVYSWYTIRYTAPTYSVSARLLVKDAYSSWGQDYFLEGMELVSQNNNIMNELGIMKSYPMMEEVAKKIDWDISYYKIGDVRTTEMYEYPEILIKTKKGSKPSGFYYLQVKEGNAFYLESNLSALGNGELYHFGDEIEIGNSSISILPRSGNITNGEKFSFHFNTIGGIARQLQNSFRVNLENKESNILLLSTEGNIPQKSIDFLNALMEVYIEEGLKENNEIATNTIAFVDSQLETIADSLVKTEVFMESFQVENMKERIFLESTLNLEQIKEMEEKLLQANLSLEYFKALEKAVSSKDSTIGIPLPELFGVSDASVTDLIRELTGLQGELQLMRFSSRENSPAMTKMRMEIQAQKQTLLTTIDAAKGKLKDNIEKIQREISREEQKVYKIPTEQREYLTIRRKNKLLSDMYTYLLTKRSEASIAKASNVAKARILDRATPYRVSYVGPNSSSIYMMNGFVGLLIPLVIIFLLYFFNNKIVDRSDLTKITSIPILGSISYKAKLESNILVNKNLKSIIAEAFRSVRTNINYMVGGKQKIKILVTSSISGEGKTFVSINLAAIYAASGKKTVIVGADMRKPKIYKDFHLDNKIGLSSYLINQASLEEVTFDTKINGLWVIPSGPLPPNPAEMLESKEMAQLISELEKEYDTIIIDSPPLGLVTDALLLNRFADMTMYIVRHNYTKQNYLKNIDQMHKDGVIKKLGIVVNAIKQKKGISSYGYSYGYGYGYGSGYGYGYGYYAEDEEGEKKGVFKRK